MNTLSDDPVSFLRSELKIRMEIRQCQIRLASSAGTEWSAKKNKNLNTKFGYQQWNTFQLKIILMDILTILAKPKYYSNETIRTVIKKKSSNKYRNLKFYQKK